ncbi:MAG: hypothetical protein H0T46_25395 [Deltaproteobacteria bacterium]|nr:hypothetical protein [Deltaproteobacteria bacterium]
MRARGWVVAGILVVLSPVAAAQPAKDSDPKPTPVDIKALRDKLQVFQDKAGGTYVVFAEPPSGSDAKVFYGTGKQLYEQINTGRSRNGDAWSLNTWAPRIPDLRPAAITRKDDGTFMRWCDGRDDAVLTEITGDKAKAILDKYQFLSPALVRRPHLLARDDSGIYYYVDRLDKAHGGKGFRVFVGKKGAMKQLALTDVASDSAGQVFSTKTGDLRLVNTTDNQTTPNTRWVKGEKKTDLIKLDTDVNSPLIFKDLGIYKFTGTLCDNI